MKRILLLDCNAVCWSVYHGLPKLSFEEVQTSIIFGFMARLFTFREDFDADHIVFAWDHPKKGDREKLFPAYKEKRRNVRKTELEEATPEELKELKSIKKQFKLLRKEVLPGLGFSNLFYQKGKEGDDIIAKVCQDHEEDIIKIIGSDLDLLQCISTRHTMHSLRTHQEIDHDWVFNRYGVPPSMWGDVKGLAGCTSDEVPGIKGVGENKAIQYLCGNMKPTGIIYKRIKESQDVIDFTRKLVVLPMKGTKSFTIEPDTCTINKFKRMIRKYGFQSFKEHGRLKDFREFFCEPSLEDIL